MSKKRLTKDSKLKKFSEQQVTIPEQLSLFELFKADRDEYSHTLKLYGIIPSKVYGKVERIQGKFLPSFERRFVYQKKNYYLKVTPARIQDANGEDRDAYMGKREELVEDALLKMAADGRRAQAVYLDNQFTVIYTRNALQEELAEQGHSYSYAQIEEAIEILFKSSVELREEDQSELNDNFHPVEAYGFRGRNGEEYTYVKFSPQVTAAIENNTYRLVNYRKLMGYSTTIARLLHKRLVHSFVYAESEKTYHFSVNSIYRDFGLNQDSLLKHKVAEVKLAIEELVKSSVVGGFTINPVYDVSRKNKLADQVFEITAHAEYVDEVIKANQDGKRRTSEMNIKKYFPEGIPSRTKKRLVE